MFTTHSSHLVAKLQDSASHSLEYEHLLNSKEEFDLNASLSLDFFILNHFHLEGARALRFLTLHPNEYFTAQNIIQILSGKSIASRCEAMEQRPEQRDLLQETAIEMTDEKTLRELKKRIQELKKLRSKNHNRRVENTRVNEELKQLQKYLLECSQKNGQLRCFDFIGRRSYQALSLNIKRFCAIIKKHDPKLNAYIDAHLQTKPYFCWMEQGFKKESTNYTNFTNLMEL